MSRVELINLLIHLLINSKWICNYFDNCFFDKSFHPKNVFAAVFAVSLRFGMFAGQKKQTSIVNVSLWAPANYDGISLHFLNIYKNNNQSIIGEHNQQRNLFPSTLFFS